MSLHTGSVEKEDLVLAGTRVRLESLSHRHVEGLVAAAAADPSLYQWSPVPQGKAEATTYVDTALASRDAGSAVSFAIIKLNDKLNDRLDDGLNDGVVIGSARFFNLDRWSWPKGHPRHGRHDPDVCEIGYTWLARSAIRTAANTEAKVLMLTHAFETWQVVGVCFHTDARNQRSRTALERIGGKFDGILRAHRMAADYIARDSVRYSIVAAEWPVVKQQLSQFLSQAQPPFSVKAAKDDKR